MVIIYKNPAHVSAVEGNEMQFPLGLNDISLYFAVTAIILLITSELLSAHNFQKGLIIERDRLRSAAHILIILFLSTIVMRIYLITITL